MNAQWIRVTKKFRCPKCGRHDWCDYSPELNLILCMRVESDRPSRNAMGGWLHILDELAAPAPYIPRRKVVEDPPLDCGPIWLQWSRNTNESQLDQLAESLGVTLQSLVDIGCVWNGTAWAFPMKDARGKMIGIRLRNNDGEKWAVKGSKQGLFYPDTKPEPTLYIVEGPTDTAAGLSIGLSVLGRPACMGCESMISEYLMVHKVRNVVVVTDNDNPDKFGIRAGRRGAKRLQESLSISSCLWLPPVKDLREFVRLGGDREAIESSVRDLVWSRPA